MLKSDHIVFDLDDTLYKEHTYAVSALSFFGRELNRLLSTDGIETQLLNMFEAGHRDAIGAVCEQHMVPNHTKKMLLEHMRSHRPNITLSVDAEQLLAFIRKQGLGFSILTDGRSVTQRAKISALGLNDAQVIVISEELGKGKPSLGGFRHIESSTNVLGSHVYVGDNVKKDFIAPNALGWKTIQLADDGCNIHEAPSVLEDQQKADYTVSQLTEIPHLLA